MLRRPFQIDVPCGAARTRSMRLGPVSQMSTFRSWCSTASTITVGHKERYYLKAEGAEPAWVSRAIAGVMRSV